jgi:ATP-dependent DNA helicase RecG
MQIEPESDKMERNLRIVNFRDISETACAFANARGGRIVIGVSDTGTLVGVNPEELDKLQQRLEGALQIVLPTPLHTIEVLEVGDKHIVTVDIEAMGFVSFCTLGGIVYKRQGSSNIRLEGGHLQQFLVERKVLTFDRLKTHAQIEDLDMNKIKEFLHKTRPNFIFREEDVKKVLMNLNLAEQNGAFFVRNDAILLFAAEPKKFLPQAEIKLVRFRGINPSDIIDSKSTRETILENLEMTIAFIERNTKTEYKIRGMKRQEIPEYPLVAIREAIVNAIVHRDYLADGAVQVSIFQDRIEISNPGNLPQGISISEIGGLSIPRNPLIYELMRELGYVEAMGTGIARIRDEMRKTGLTEPKFEQIGNYFRVTLYAKMANRNPEKLTDRQRDAMRYLMEQDRITSTQYCKLFLVSFPTAVSDLNQMIKLGLVKKIGKTRGTYYVLAKKI